MTEQGKDFQLFLKKKKMYHIGTLLIPFNIVDRSRKTALPSRKAAECDQLGNISVELTKPPTPARLQNGHSFGKQAEADPKVNSYWYQARDFSGTLGESGPLLKSKSWRARTQQPHPSLQGHR